MPVVIEAAFLIKILPWESQVLREDAQALRIGLRRCSTKGLGDMAPSDFSIFVGNDTRGV
jgi:hypothetical protein